MADTLQAAQRVTIIINAVDPGIIRLSVRDRISFRATVRGVYPEGWEVLTCR